MDAQWWAEYLRDTGLVAGARAAVNLARGTAPGTILAVAETAHHPYHGPLPPRHARPPGPPARAEAPPMILLCLECETRFRFDFNDTAGAVGKGEAQGPHGRGAPESSELRGRAACKVEPSYPECGSPDLEPE